MKYINVFETAEDLASAKANLAKPQLAYVSADGTILSMADGGTPGPTPVMPPNSEIWYTTTNGQIITPQYTTGFGAQFVSNTYENGKGILKFDNDITNIPWSPRDFIGPFTGLTTLLSMTIPSSVQVISGGINDCIELISFTMFDGITQMGPTSFNNCSKLTTVNMATTFSSITGGAFSWCSSLPIENNIQYADTLAIKVIDDTLNTCILKNNTMYIGGGFCMYNTAITNITIPASVILIEEWAFSRCSNLNNITSLNTVPPTLKPNVFYDVPATCPIYVPEASVDAYKAASGWSDRAAYIQAMPTE